MCSEVFRGKAMSAPMGRFLGENSGPPEPHSPRRFAHPGKHFSPHWTNRLRIRALELESITCPQRHPERKWAQQPQFVGTEEHVNVPPVFCLTVLDFTKATSPFSTRHLQSARQGERREEVRDICVIQEGQLVDPGLTIWYQQLWLPFYH